MKKFFGLFVCFGLLFQSFAPTVLALTETEAIKEQMPIVQQKETEEKEVKEVLEETEKTAILPNESSIPNLKEETPSEAEFEGTGVLEIDTKFVLPNYNVENPNIGMRLYDEKGNQTQIDFNGVTTMLTISYRLGEQTGTATIKKMDKEGSVINGTSDAEVLYYAVTFYDLKQGNYAVELYGNGYKTFKKNGIALTDYSKRVTLSNEKGLFEVGDVNGDAIVSHADVDALLLQMGNEDASILRQYDLNRDGKIDVSDLAMLATILNGEKRNCYNRYECDCP